jgi:hypothetical protein
MGRTRRAVAEYAREAGFGRIILVHRPFRDSWLTGLLVGVTVIVVVVAGIAVFALTLEESPLWRWPVLGVLAFAWVTFAVCIWGPTPDAERRRLFVVTEHGLLVLSPGEDDPVVVAEYWDDLKISWTGRVHELTWQEGTRERTLTIPAMPGRDELITAVRLSGRVRRWPPRRLFITGVAAVTSALVVWFAAVPLVIDMVLGERPDDITDFAEMCKGDGGFGRAALYQGDGPHPIAVYGDISYPDYSEGNVKDDKNRPLPDTVQLVGCVQKIGRASSASLTSCPYEGGYTQTIYQGRYRVDVYEARTRRHVSTLLIDGDGVTDCSHWLYVRRDAPHNQTYDTAPDEAGYARLLHRLINDPAR